MSGQGIKSQSTCTRAWGRFIYISLFWSFPLLTLGVRYSVFRRVVNYYSDDPTGLSEEGEDAFDMRKPLSRDVHLKHAREDGENFLVNPEDVT